MSRQASGCRFRETGDAGAADKGRVVDGLDQTVEAQSDATEGCGHRSARQPIQAHRRALSVIMSGGLAPAPSDRAPSDPAPGAPLPDRPSRHRA
jgi:hypothetical protein